MTDFFLISLLSFEHGPLFLKITPGIMTVSKQNNGSMKRKYL